MDWALGSDSSARPHIHSSDDRPCYALENPRPKGGTKSRFINPDCLRKRGVCPIPAEPVQIHSGVLVARGGWSRKWGIATEDSPSLSPQFFCACVCDFACGLESFGSLSDEDQIVPVLGYSADIDVMASCLAGNGGARKPIKLGKRDILRLLLAYGHLEVVESIIKTQSCQPRLEVSMNIFDGSCPETAAPNSGGRLK
jgi:hypothetical protein